MQAANTSYKTLSDRFYSPLGKVVATVTLLTVLNGCAGVARLNSPQLASGSSVATDIKEENPGQKVLDSLLSDRSIDTAFKEGEYLEGIARLPYDFARKTVIRAVMAPKTFLYDTPSSVIDDAKERIKNSKTPEEERGHFWGSIIFAPVLYIGKIFENIVKKKEKNPIEAVLHGTAYGLIGAELSGNGKHGHDTPQSTPAPVGPGGGGGI
ncbi:hypothetical protein HYV81_04645 [Candidatus Woesearchaeota archaeon]|nr:hypothetical protein [Candidatus Woesearchaeota archaeon]